MEGANFDEPVFADSLGGVHLASKLILIASNPTGYQRQCMCIFLISNYMPHALYSLRKMYL